MYRYWDNIYVFEIGNLLSFKIIPQLLSVLTFTLHYCKQDKACVVLQYNNSANPVIITYTARQFNPCLGNRGQGTAKCKSILQLRWVSKYRLRCQIVMQFPYQCLDECTMVILLVQFHWAIPKFLCWFICRIVIHVDIVIITTLRYKTANFKTMKLHLLLYLI